MTIWLNGEFLDQNRAIAATDRGYLLADGAFETLLFSRGALAFPEAHMKRLRLGLDILGIEPPQSLRQLQMIVTELCRLQNLSGDASCRVTVTRGTGPRGLAPPMDATPCMLVTVASLAPKEALPRRLIVFDGMRKNASPFSRFKYLGGYGQNIAALQFAKCEGADDALLLNDQGLLVCASAANIFFCNAHGEVKTPSIESGAMPGIVRETLVARGEVNIADLFPDDLKDHCLFISNSLIGVKSAHMVRQEFELNESQEAALQRIQDIYASALTESLDNGAQDDLR